jgi:hypothetical protein
MLAQMEPTEMDERVAVEMMDGGDPYAVMTAVLIRGFTALCRAWGADVLPEDFDPRPSDKQPSGRQHSSTVENASPNKAAAFMAMTMGRPSTNS